MPSVAKLLNQTIQLSRRQRDQQGNPLNDRFGRPSFSAPASVLARKVEHDGVRRTATGEDVEDESEVITGPDTPVRAGDHIDNEEVRRVITRRNKRGQIIGFWSYL